MTQRRESATVAALGELTSSSPGRHEFLLHHVLKGREQLQDATRLILATPLDAAPGRLLLLLGTSDAAGGEALEWTSVGLDEAGYAYIAQAPSLRLPPSERLRYFVPFLEHADPLIAEDAFREFGHAPFDAVAQAAGLLPQERLRQWLLDVNFPQDRKGFLGLALGLAPDEQQRAANAAFLRDLILAPASDFRAGFDGVLGGYLVAAGEPALDLIEERFLANPQAADGDARHAIQALRFYHEYGHAIPQERLNQAARHLLARPEFAATTIADLARWGDWAALERIVALYDQPSYNRPDVHRAVIAYLLVCPESAAAKELRRLRTLDPQTVAATEQSLSLFGDR